MLSTEHGKQASVVAVITSSLVLLINDLPFISVVIYQPDEVEAFWTFPSTLPRLWYGLRL